MTDTAPVPQHAQFCTIFTEGKCICGFGTNINTPAAPQPDLRERCYQWLGRYLREEDAVDASLEMSAVIEAETASLRAERDMWGKMAGEQVARITERRRERDEARAQVAQLTAILDTPEIEDFDKAVPLEAAHQVKRWGSEHDSGKLPADWFWLVGYLAGKALYSHLAGDVEKAKHHCISTAAVLRNWHAHIRSGETKMRPGIEDPALAEADARE